MFGIGAANLEELKNSPFLKIEGFKKEFDQQPKERIMRVKRLCL